MEVLCQDFLLLFYETGSQAAKADLELTVVKDGLNT